MMELDVDVNAHAEIAYVHVSSRRDYCAGFRIQTQG